MDVDNFKHKKSLGQNFLKDNTILDNIVKAIDLKENDLVLEIGPGQGALTKKLQTKNVNLICYEIDERTKPYLEKLSNVKTEIIYADFLKVDIKKDIEKYQYHNLYVIANLPYYITTPIIKKIIDSKIDVDGMLLMVQKEVADRFGAKPKSKDYGSLTIYLNYYFNITKLFNVPASCFDPAPKVDSAVVKFQKRKEEFPVINEEMFFKLVQDAFKQKRKNLKNNLTNYDLKKIESVLTNYNLSLQNRAEEIPIEVFIDLANKLN